MAYLIIIVALLAIYVALLSNLHRFNNTRKANRAFFAVIFASYLLYVLQVFLIVGYKNLNFHNVLATANISPFMFSITPLIYFSCGKLQKHLQILVALLSVGMILSPTLNAVTYAINDHPLSFLPVLDYVAHLALSLWGTYLVKSRQIELCKQNSALSSSIILGVAGFMIVLNCIFNTSFFGLSLTGKHNIYGNVITDNSLISACIYFIGLCSILIAGYVYGKQIAKRT